jgi:hypothetical protein
LAADPHPKVLNVHLIPHSHDDVGWRKVRLLLSLSLSLSLCLIATYELHFISVVGGTPDYSYHFLSFVSLFSDRVAQTVEQYYYPDRNATLDDRGSVRSIITTVVQALTVSEARTFTVVEQKFFGMWWREQTGAVRDAVRFLVANDQLTFANGGWCMHDEAAAHYVGMIDQTTTGHTFLNNALGVVPRTAWQLDPFGHSATQANLLTAAVGMDAVYFGRIDHQDRALRRNASECEGLWNATKHWNRPVFWGLTGSYGGNYGPPGEGFCFDVLCRDEPLVGANTTRLEQRIRTFLGYLKTQAYETKGNHIMITMGTDFNASRE